MLPLTSSRLREYEMALAHTPVLLEELVELLRPAAGETAIDCTFGAGGHAEAVAASARPEGRLIACDRDPSVAEFFRDVARAAPCACELYHGNFADVLAERDDASADIVYMDLGVSSMQLDRRERGFSLRLRRAARHAHGPRAGVTAADLVNTLRRGRAHRHLPPLRRGALRAEHRPRHRRASARGARSRRPASWSRSSSAPSPRRPGSAPATRRAASSRRCASSSTTSWTRSRRGLDEAYRVLRPGGRLAAISFHSLEDRIVKEFFGHGGRLHLPAGPAASASAVTSRRCAC